MRLLFKIAKNIFNLVSKRIDTACQEWRETGLSRTVYRNPDRDYIVLIVKGHQAKDFAAAKIAINEIINRTTIKHNDKPVWASFLSNKNALRKLKKIEKDNSVIIIRDNQRCELRFFGAPNKCGIAKWAIFAMVSAEVKAGKFINCTPIFNLVLNFTSISMNS